MQGSPQPSRHKDPLHVCCIHYTPDAYNSLTVRACNTLSVPACAAPCSQEFHSKDASACLSITTYDLSAVYCGRVRREMWRWLPVAVLLACAAAGVSAAEQPSDAAGTPYDVHITRCVGMLGCLLVALAEVPVSVPSVPDTALARSLSAHSV